MFAVRGLDLSLCVFVLVYGVLSFTVSWGWRTVWLRVRKSSARRCSDLLFALRMLPFAVAATVTLVFTVPSFILLEPRAIHEPMGILPVALGLSGFLLLLAGALKARAALVKASHAIAEWSSEARILDSHASVPVLWIERKFPAFTTAGILRPKVLVSDSAEFVLTERELGTALRHEFAHVRRWDNLKKLVLHFVVFPGMAELETAWLEAIEMAADDAAVSSAGEALDLAAALIKLSRMIPLQPAVELTTSLVHTPLASVNARVARLIGWNKGQATPAHSLSARYVLPPALVLAAALVMTYGQLLVRTHDITEWLLR